jgi:hypothetical protein
VCGDVLKTRWLELWNSHCKWSFSSSREVNFEVGFHQQPHKNISWFGLSIFQFGCNKSVEKCQG